MQLTLSTELVRNAIFTLDNGQVIYKTTHPHHLGLGTTTLYKIKPNNDPMDMQDQLNAIGEIEWRIVGSSTFRLNGEEMQSNEFLPAHGILGRKRTFTGPDGYPYRWDMEVTLPYGTVVLSRDDNSRIEVARFHRGSLGVLGRKRQPHLEIHPDGEHMLDLIILTFVYVEKIRMDRDCENSGPYL